MKLDTKTSQPFLMSEGVTQYINKAVYEHYFPSIAFFHICLQVPIIPSAELFELNNNSIPLD